ncbi:MAG TPA: chorismate mutase, partial [Alphaproteobacteria bacterium]|nr:chorismate mutase [Alphaproteobacteria bacterium]
PMAASPTLDELRREIDRIDDAMHDLIMQRATLIERISAAKAAAGPSVFIRPGREAAIQRRLSGRHSGIFPRTALLRIWREIINAFTALQGPFSVGATAPEAGRGFWDVARDQFGSLVPMTAFPTPDLAVRAVADGGVTVAVVPWPQPDDLSPWWPMLLDEPGAPRIILRLPFAGRGNGRGELRDALTVARAEPEATGSDRSLIALDLKGTPDDLPAALRDCGLALTATLSDLAHSEGSLRLVEVDGFLAPGDERLAALGRRLGPALRRAVPLGGYPVPLSL